MTAIYQRGGGEVEVELVYRERESSQLDGRDDDGDDDGIDSVRLLCNLVYLPYIHCITSRGDTESNCLSR